MIKNLPAMWEIQVGSLGWENPLEKGTILFPTNFALVTLTFMLGMVLYSSSEPFWNLTKRKLN